MPTMGYSYKKLQGPDHVQLQDLPLSSATYSAREELPSPQNLFDRNPKTTSWAIKMLIASLVLLSALSLTRAAVLEKKQAASTASSASSSTTRVPQLFQTTPELFTGMFPSLKLQHSSTDGAKRSNSNRACALPRREQSRSFRTSHLRSKHPS